MSFVLAIITVSHCFYAFNFIVIIIIIVTRIITLLQCDYIIILLL
jgi:hypothetical protein